MSDVNTTTAPDSGSAATLTRLEQEGEIAADYLEGLLDIADLDGDLVPNEIDVCALVSNVLQTDTDLDGLGDACDIDANGDGIPDIDIDLDGVVDGVDNCLLSVNPSQLDTDLDTIGDACDLDADGDGVRDDREI